MAFPFIAVAIIIAGLGIALALMAPKPQQENARPGKLSDFNFPRANKGDPIPYIKGTTRLRYPNTIALGGFRAVKITEKVKTGLFSSKKVTVGYKYHVTLGLGLCLGPGAVIKRIWYGKKVLWSGSASGGDTITIDEPEFLGGEEKNGGLGGDIRVYGGSFSQTRDAALADVADPNIPAFVGLAYLVFDDFWFGNSTSIEPINVEVQVFSDVLDLAGGTGHNVMPNGLDENPVETMADVIVTRWGRLGFGVDAIDLANFQAVAETIYTENNGGSWELAKPNRGKDFIGEVLRQLDATIYQDPQTGKIKIKLLRNDYVIEDLPVLDPSNVKTIRNLSKTLWQQTVNQIRVKFRDRDDQYADDAAQDQDFANINFQNKVRGEDIAMPGVYRADLAQILAARERSKISVPLFAFELTCNREQVILRPGDPFILQWPEYGIVQIVMRVRTFGLGSLDRGEVTIVAGQDEFAAADVVFAPPSGSGHIPTTTDPAEITEQIYLEAPLWFVLRLLPDETGDGAFAWALPRQPGTSSVGFDLATSEDGFTTFATGISNASYTGSARLNGAYADTVAADDGYDSGVTGIVVDGFDAAGFVPESGGDIQTLGEGLMIIGSEILGYETATDLGGGSYRLTNVRRGLLDTEFGNHADNALVVFLSNIDGLYDESELGATASITFRLRDRTVSGAYDITLEDNLVINFDQRMLRPAPPDYARVDNLRSGSTPRSATTAISWRERNRFDTTIRFEDDATQSPEGGQDNEVKWRINAGAWTTVYVSGASTTIDTSGFAASDVLDVEVRSRRSSLLSRVASKVTVTLT